jgi:hypothetical protein
MTKAKEATMKAILTALMMTSFPSTSFTEDLKSPDAFNSIQNQEERSIALFYEAGKVLTHPRCVNCHPAGDRPLQGSDSHLHRPLAVRGDGGLGVAGMRCYSCHGQKNYDPARIPGHPEWHLAPIEMAWQGKSLRQICEHLKDPTRNGGRDMATLIAHMAVDSLVGWGWHPGAGRDPVPGTQQQFGALIKAWKDMGATCPKN